MVIGVANHQIRREGLSEDSSEEKNDTCKSSFCDIACSMKKVTDILHGLIGELTFPKKRRITNITSEAELYKRKQHP